MFFLPPTRSCMHSDLETIVPEHQLSFELKRKTANKETRLLSILANYTQQAPQNNLSNDSGGGVQ